MALGIIPLHRRWVRRLLINGAEERRMAEGGEGGPLHQRPYEFV